MPRSQPSTPFNRIIAIIPASGKGERFGQPKTEATFKGKAFAEHITASLRKAGIENFLVAASYDTPDMLATLRRAKDDLKHREATGYLIWPIDHPFVKPETVSALCEAFLALPDAVLRPSFGGKCGHPVLIPAWLDLSQDDQGQGLAGIIRSQACSVIDLPVSDGAILKNVTYPRDLEE